MNDHYFTAQPDAAHDFQIIETEILGQSFVFHTDSGVFSKTRMDYGSKVLVETFVDQYPTLLAGTTIYEFGSGYGPISIVLAKLYPEGHVFGFEVNERALTLAKSNARANKVVNADFYLKDVATGAFDRETPPAFVLTNPPIRAGKAVIQAFVTQAFDILPVGGELWLVIQKKQGAPSMQTYMEEVFGQVDLVERDKGYWILRSVKF